MSDAIRDQQPPTEGQGADAWELVMKDMAERRRIGIERYGMPLRHDNGRDHLVDAYQEALDLAVYLRNEIEKRNHESRQNGRLEFDPVREILRPVFHRVRWWSWVPERNTATVFDVFGRTYIERAGTVEQAMTAIVKKISTINEW